MIKGHPLKGCLFYFPNKKLQRFIFGNMKKSEGELAHSCMAGYCPGSRYLANGKKIRGGTRSQLRRPLFPLGLPLVGHAEKHVIKRGICGNFEGACEVVQLANTHFPGLVSEFVGRVGGGEGVSGGGSLKRFVKVLRFWDFALSIKMALSERSEFDIFMLVLSKIPEP